MDPSKDTEEKVHKFVDKIRDKNHISEKTAECIKDRTKETKPGAYTERPKHT